MHRRDGQFSVTNKENRTGIESAAMERRRRSIEEPERTLETRSTFLAAGNRIANFGLAPMPLEKAVCWFLSPVSKSGLPGLSPNFFSCFSAFDEQALAFFFPGFIFA
jgi:hypothetical protein